MASDHSSGSLPKSGVSTRVYEKYIFGNISPLSAMKHK